MDKPQLYGTLLSHFTRKIRILPHEFGVAFERIRPRVAARSKWARIEALLRYRAFVVTYATAREAWRAGAAVTFPSGTYWLRRFANCRSRHRVTPHRG